MKPFTIRKAQQPSRAGAHTGLAAGDLSVDASMVKYNTAAGPDRGNSVNYGPMNSAKDDTPAVIDPEDETLLEQTDLDKLAEDFPGKTPENPWIKEQTNKQYLTALKVSSVFCGGRCVPSPYQACGVSYLSSDFTFDSGMRFKCALFCVPTRRFLSQRIIIMIL